MTPKERDEVSLLIRRAMSHADSVAARQGVRTLVRLDAVQYAVARMREVFEEAGFEPGDGIACANRRPA
jgi:hypothetical protein